jgi:hypothetical protein
MANNTMGANVKFTEKQKQIVVDMYAKCGSPMSEIIERCKSDIPEDIRFSISRETVYKFLKEKNIPLIRKTGVKHNLIGKTFGYLTVTDMAQTKKSGRLHEWRAMCRCNNCGKENVDVRPQALLRGATTSCGCRRDLYITNSGKNNKHYKGYEGLNGTYWGKIKKRAENRGHTLIVSIEYAWNLYLQQDCKCALTGLPIGFGVAIANRKSSDTTASLDRIDSSKEYVEGNVQWVHKNINIMKNVYDQDYFIHLCELVTKNKKA